MAAAMLIYWQVLSGNITSKSDVGTYTYGTAAPWRPHAVTAVSGGSSQGAATYSYDANGSLVERINTAGGHQTLDYTSFTW